MIALVSKPFKWMFKGLSFWGKNQQNLRKIFFFFFFLGGGGAKNQQNLQTNTIYGAGRVCWEVHICSEMMPCSVQVVHVSIYLSISYERIKNWSLKRDVITKTKNLWFIQRQATSFQPRFRQETNIRNQYKRQRLNQQSISLWFFFFQKESANSSICMTFVYKSYTYIYIYILVFNYRHLGDTQRPEKYGAGHLRPPRRFVKRPLEQAGLPGPFQQLLRAHRSGGQL